MCYLSSQSPIDRNETETQLIFMDCDFISVGYENIFIYFFCDTKNLGGGGVDFVSGQIGWHLNKMTCICKEILGLHKGMVTPHLPSPSPVSPPPYLYSFQSADQWVTNTCIGNTSSVFQEYKSFMSLCKHGNSTIQYIINFFSHPTPPPPTSPPPSISSLSQIFKVKNKLRFKRAE